MRTSIIIRKGFILTIVILLTVNTSFTSGQARYIGRNFIEYCSRVPWEDVFVHTDREKYIAGENIWFNVYVFDRKSMMPSSLSKVGYVEILNYDNRPVIRKRVYLENGCGPGQINLPDTLASGIYSVRAYTAWMKNFLPNGCFVKEVTIYNGMNIHAAVKRPAFKTTPEQRKQYETTGFRLITDNTRPGNLGLYFVTTAEFRNANDDACNILVQTRGNLNVSELIPLVGDTTSRIISKKQLMAGINHITAFDSHGRPLAEKYVYTPAASTADFMISADQQYGKREKIILAPDGKTGYRNLSISVTPVEGSGKSDLQDFMLLGNEFGTDVAAKLGTRNLSDLSQQAIDSILSDISSRWIDWDVISGRDTLIIRYQPEASMHFLSGKLMNISSPNDYVIMSIPGKQANFQYAITGKSGEFDFGIPIDDQTRELIIQSDDTKGAINLESSFSEEYPPAGHVSDTIPVPDFIPDWSVNYQVRKIYGTIMSENLPPRLRTAGTKRFYGKPDIELILADYIKLPLMEEIFFELLPGTYLKKRRSSYEIYVTDPVTDLTYEYPTTLFVDGVRVDDANAIAALDPELVEQIDVVRERYIVGDYLFHGIVNIITKAGDFTSVPLPEYAVKTFYRVIDPVERFISPEYNSTELKKSRIPDFRNTLWWNPSVNPGSPVEFWSSDVPGKYRITINGISQDGSPISAERIFTVE